MALLNMREVSLSLGGPRLLDRLDFQVERGERVCLLGRNGAGKSTLLKLIAGDLSPEEGEILRQQGTRIARLAQEIPQGRGGTVFEEVARGLNRADDASGGLLGRSAEPTTDDDHDHEGDWRNRHKVERVISRMNLEPDAEFEVLSAGMKRRVLLARALVREPDILLLDEPTNHLDIEAIQWLEDFLLRYEGTLIFVTHDRMFLGRLATRIIELDRGRLFDWSCDYETFLKRKEELLAGEAQQQALFDKRLAQEEVWIRQGIQARRTRNEGRVRSLEKMRETRAARRDRTGTAQIRAQEAERSGALVVDAKGVSVRFDDRPIIRDFSTTIMRGDKIGIVGPNGSGKTTLLRVLLGQLPPREGTVRLGTRMEVAYFDQLRAALDEEKTVQENVADGYDNVVIDGESRHVISYLSDFLFSPDRARSYVKHLSGGERNRLLLAKLFTKPSNVLVMDEPTNDLDVETLELLEELLLNYQGTLLLVSHDRAFLNNVATSVLVIEPGGRVKEYGGGYDDAVRQRGNEAPAPTVNPPAKPTAPRPQQREAATRKLSFKEQRELEGLPQRLESLEASRHERHQAMADPSFYQKPRAEIAAANAELEALEQELADAYLRWEALENALG